MTEAEDKYAQKRADILANSIQSACTPAWGYFGLTGSLAIGDNSYAPRMTKKAEQVEGEASDMSRNIQAGSLKRGAGPDVYFTFEPPLAIGDPYSDKKDAKGKVWMVDPESAFKPPGIIKRGANKLGYEYIPHCDSAKDPKEVKEKYKDYTPPRQILTNPLKKGGGGVLTTGVLFGWSEERRFIEHVPDDFDAARKDRQKDLEEHRKLLQEAPFKGIDYGNRAFGNNTETYHSDIPTHVPRDKEVEDTSRRYPHESAFRPTHPSKKGALKGCMGQYPEWVPDPVQEAPCKKKAAEESPAAFKPIAPNKFCNPMPSVVTNLRNMRNERPSSFARPCL